MPKASTDFALGEEKFRRSSRETELVDLAPEKILEIGLAQLKKEQDAFAEAAKIIDPSKPPIEVFKANPTEHPTALTLIADMTKNLEQIRKFVIGHKLITIPSEVRAR